MSFLLGLIVVVLSIPLLLTAMTIYRFHRRRRRSYRDEYSTSPFESKIDYDEVSFISQDGVRLKGWVMTHLRKKKFIVGCHGIHGKKSDLIGIGSGLYRKGFNVFLFDMRNCGQSASAKQSIAYYEQRDMRAAIEWVIERYPKASIGVIGFSMGAVLSILAANQAPVKAIVADSSFTSLKALARREYYRWHLGWAADFMIAFTSKLYSRWQGFSFLQISPISVVSADQDRAYFFIHGEQDVVIPSQHSRELYQACVAEHKDLWIENENHCGLYYKDRQRYIDKVAKFFKAYVK